MIKYTTGNILDATEEAIVIPVNCVGVAGAGLALQCKEKYPWWYTNYHHWCQSGKSGIGKLTDYLLMGTPRWIISFPTKKHWRNPSHICYIMCGLEALVDFVELKNIKSVAVPWLGCGLGGLNKGEVRKLFEKYFVDSDVEYVVYEWR